MHLTTTKHLLRIAVDLTPLLAGGRNGGVKPFIFEYLSWLGRQRIVPLQFVFLTRRSSHADVRTLARFEDLLHCILDDGGEGEIRSTNHSPRENLWLNPPADLLNRLQVDLFYTPFGLCTWHYPGVPSIATVVDVIHKDYPYSLQPSELTQRDQVFREIAAVADYVQCISNYTIGRMAHHYRFPENRMFCSYIAIHERLKLQTVGAVRSTSERPYFLYPANAWKHKNHAVLLMAYRAYVNSVATEAWDLVLTGFDDEPMQEVLRLAATLGIGPGVRYLGHLEPSAYATVWRNAGALVFPSLHEGFGIPILEAMAFGLPVISSSSGSLPEVGGSACLYADALKPLELAEALRRVTQEPDLRARLREHGAARLRDFSFEADARKFLDKIVTCARSPARLSSKGIYPDGWTGPQAVMGTPRIGTLACLHLNVRPMPVGRRLRLFQGAGFLGQFDLPSHRVLSLKIRTFADGRPLILEVPDASKLSPDDHRTHGVCLESVQLEDASGRPTDLFRQN